MQVTTDQLNGRLTAQEAVTNSQDLNAINSTSLSYASGTISTPHNFSATGQVNANNGVAVGGSTVITSSGLISGNAISGNVSSATTATTAGHVSGLSLGVGISGWPISSSAGATASGLQIAGGLCDALNSLASALTNSGIA